MYLNTNSSLTDSSIDIHTFLEPGVIVAQKGNRFSLYTKVHGLTEGNNALQAVSSDSELRQLINDYSSRNIPRLKTVGNYANVHVWHEICGINIDNILEYTLFPHLPARRKTMNLLRMNEIDINMGLRIFGYLIVNIPGDYQFYMSTVNANAQMWLSLSENPLSSELMCQINSLVETDVKYVSKTVRLSLQKYYFDIVVKTGKDQGKFLIKWLTPENQHFVHIEESNLLPYYNDIGYAMDEVILDFNILRNLPMLYARRKITDMYYDDENLRRSKIYLLPFVPEKDTENLFFILFVFTFVLNT